MTVRVTPPDRRRWLTRDGRRVCWSEWGERDAPAVVLCSGAAMASSLGIDPRAVPHLPVRVLVVDRAGIGGSDPDPDKTIESCSRDVAAVVEEAGIDGPPVGVGFSQGAPFAVDLAGRGYVRRLAIVSGQDEFVRPAVRDILDDRVAAMVQDIHSDPPAFEEALGSYADAEGLWELVVSTSSSHDRQVYTSSPFAEAYRRCLAEGFAQGAQGYVRDLVLAMQRWPTQPEDVGTEVHLWYGGRDASTVHSPDLGADLASRFPRAIRHVLPDEGGSLLWTRTREILTPLLG